MDFLEILQKRRSCHHFNPNKKIPDRDLVKLIEQSSLTPSGYNAQPWEFIIIREKENIAKIQEIAFKQKHIGNASAIIIVLGDKNIGRNVDQILADWLKYGYCTEEEIPAYRNSIAKVRSEDKRKDMALRNSMLACMTIMLAAENMGYQTCPIMGFSQWQLTEFLNIPQDYLISLIIAIGYNEISEEKPRLPRKKAEEMIHWERFPKQERV